MGMSVSRELNYRQFIESKAQLVTKKLVVLSQIKQYFIQLHVYRAQIKPVMKYCSHIFEYQLSALDSVQWQIAAKLIRDPNLYHHLQPLDLRRMVSSLSLFYSYYHGHCSRELQSLVPAVPSYRRLTGGRIAKHPFMVDADCSRMARFSR